MLLLRLYRESDCILRADFSEKIHSGRSRNDQVLLDLKLFTRAEIKEVAEAVEQLFHVLGIIQCIKILGKHMIT